MNWNSKSVIFIKAARFAAALTLLLAASTASAITIAWDPNSEPDLAGYNLYYAPLASPAVKVNVGNETSFILESLQPGTTYYFYATAYNTAGLESAPSEEITYTVPSKVNITWAESPAPGVAGYHLYYSAEGGAETKVDVGNVTAYEVELPGEDARYRIAAYNSLGMEVDFYEAVHSSGFEVSLDRVTPGSAAQQLATDAITGGNWKGAYGSEGFVIAGDSKNLPSWAEITTERASQWLWTGSSEQTYVTRRAGTGRVAACWYAVNGFDVNVNLNDGQPHKVSFYFLEYGPGGRTQRIDVIDAATGVLLSTTNLAGFNSGRHLCWEIQGSVKFRFTQTGPYNAVASALFLDPVEPEASEPGATEAVFLGADTVTQGSWKGVYGTEGHHIVADSTRLPDDARVHTGGESQWIWKLTSSEPRALERAGTGRVAACWYSSSSFMIRVAAGDSPRAVSLYCLDFDGNRTQRIEVVNAMTGEVLHTVNLSHFKQGVYLSYQITGEVDFRVSRTGPANAVVSGLFFDPAEL